MSGAELLATYVANALMYAAGALMMCALLPHRQHYPARVAAALAALVGYQYLPLLPIAPGTTFGSIASMTAYFGFVVVILGLGTLFVARCSARTSALVAVVSYTLENAGASAGELVGQLLRMAGARPPVLGDAFWRGVVCCCAAFALFWALVVRRLRRHALDVRGGTGSLVLLGGVLLLNIVFDLCIKYVRAYSLPVGFTLTFRVVELAICLYALWLEYEMLDNHNLRVVAATTQRMLHEREQQYELSRKNIDAINIKAHDIRHQIRHLQDDGTRVVDREALAEIAHQVDIYDSKVQTGNEALDTILTEKGLHGEQAGVTLSCMADGAALSFMRPADIYALFGNALDNAIEAASGLADEGRRNVSLLVRRVGQMVSVHVENYCEKAPTFRSDGLPQTTKADTSRHGFGVRSMRAIAESYGGTATFGCEGESFYVNVLIPIPEDDGA